MAKKKGSALEQAGTPQAGMVGSTAMSLVQMLLQSGIDGRGPLESAEEVAKQALASEGSVEAAVSKVASSHMRLAAAEGFVTGLGGFVMLPVALPANVAGFYLLATRQSAAIAHLRGYDLDDQRIRSAVLLSLVGSEGDQILQTAGAAVPGGKMARAATSQLPGPALMIVNKAVGFRLLTQVSKRSLTRLGKAIPLAGGFIGAGLDALLIRSMAQHAEHEFPQQ